jgi:TonB-linked SusC/RagA family outer membrane protein
MLNIHQYVAMRKEALSNDGLPVDITNAPDLIAWDTTKSTDWQKYLWGHQGKTTDAEASVSGGDSHTTFRLGAGYHYLTEILTSSGANKRGSLTFNINHKSLNQRLNLSLTGTYTVVSADMIYTPGAITLPPNAPPVYDNKGNLNYAGWIPLDQTYPFASLLQPYTMKTNLLNSNLNLGYEFLKGLVFRTSLGYNNIQTDQKFLQPISSQNPAFGLLGNATFGYTFIHNLIVEPQLEYTKFIGKGRLNILAGGSLQSTSVSSVYMAGIGYTNDALLTSVSNAIRQYSKNSLVDYKYEAVFGRINYDFQNKYILNLNARRDGSSKFGPGRQFGNFGSVGAAWIFSEENWLKNHLKFISFGKIRGSYGVAGSDDIAPFSYLSQWEFNQRTYNNNQVLSPIGHTDSTLHWQANHKLEAAINFGFWHDRMTLEVAWYRNRCNNQLVAFPTPNFTGFASVTTNSPADVENKGWEFQINGKVIEAKYFSWISKFNIGINRNKLISYPNLAQSPYANLYFLGKSLQTKKILHFTGVDPQTGLYTYLDNNHDGQITIDYTGTTTDDTHTVDMAAKFDGGFANTFRYKNWELSVFFYFKKQMGVNALNALDAPGDNTNQPTNVLKRWQKTGDITNVALFTTMPYNWPFVYYQRSDAVITDASFIRLQNVSLTYTLPNKLSRKAGIDNLGIYLKGENLFTITSYDGVDPEVQNFGNLPRARTIIAGISCSL